MSVPAFEELGKSFHNIFRTGYTFDLLKIKLRGADKDDIKLECDGTLELKKFTVSFFSFVYNEFFCKINFFKI